MGFGAWDILLGAWALVWFGLLNARFSDLDSALCTVLYLDSICQTVRLSVDG